MRQSSVAGALVFVLALGVAAAAQQTGKAVNIPKQTAGSHGREATSETPPQPGFDPAGYVIGPDDLLEVSVWKEPDFSIKLPVRADGKISVPLIHDVQAAGLTPVQLALLIAELLKKYVNQPQVTVIPVQINSRRVYVLGEVTRPGAIPLLANMTILQALGSAGSFTQFADRKKVYVLRIENGKHLRYPFNYKKVVRGDVPEQNIVLKPGDTIIVP